jgi:hypothetical protein
MNPQYPIFIPTKGRHESRLTIKALQSLGVPFTAVIEKQDYANYSQVVPKDRLLILPHQDQGLTVTRNWIWDYAQNECKTPYFWTMDDNLRAFYRLNKGIKARVTSGTFLRIIEQFAERYTNLLVSGMAYEMFCPRKKKHPPFILNTRIYSNMLIRTNIPYRNRLFFNDDTDLCLQILKDGHCTCQFNAFLADKQATMQLRGGMTEHYEATNKRWEFCKELQNAHPDVVKITQKWGRWQHQVDYRPFAKNKLIRRPGVVVEAGVNDFGLVVKRREPETPSNACGPSKTTRQRSRRTTGKPS